MATSPISQYLTRILTSIYGRDVRQAIHDAINQCYKDVNSPTLNLDAFEVVLDERIADGTIANMTIADGSITQDKLSADVHLGVEDGEVTHQKLSAEVQKVLDYPYIVITDETIWEEGTITSGNNSENTARVRTVDYIPEEIDLISALDGYQFAVCVYWKTTNNFIGYLKNDGRIDISFSVNDNMLSFADIKDFKDIYSVRLICRKSTNEVIDTSASVNIQMIVDFKRYTETLFDTLNEGKADQIQYKDDRLELKSGDKVLTAVDIVQVKNPIPELHLDGDTSEMTHDVSVPVRYTFIDEKNKKQRLGWCTVKWQGDSSLAYPKKNYTIKFFHDALCKRKDKINFFDMAKQSKWVTKANWIDHSHARNIFCARLWAKIVKSRHSEVPEELSVSPCYGAVNGYPIRIYENGEYHGLYTLNIPKDDWTFGMDEKNPSHFALYGQKNGGAGKYIETSNNFRKLWSGVDGDNWEVEVGTNSDTVKKALNDLISFVMNSTDEEFIANLGSYLDVESAIDYYLFLDVIGSIGNLAKNIILACYDGIKFYCSAYDLDSTLGLYWNGTKFLDPEMPFPQGNEEPNSLLWERIVNCFGDDLVARYSELRSGILSLDYMLRELRYFQEFIPSGELETDYNRWPAIPNGNVDHYNQIAEYLEARLPFVDSEIVKLSSEYVPCEGLEISEDTVTMDGVATYALTVMKAPENCSDTLLWYSSNPDILKIESGVLYAKMDGTVVVTVKCGDYKGTCNVTIVNRDDTAMYGLDNGTITFEDGASASITNKNHVELQATSSGSINITNLKQNGTKFSGLTNVNDMPRLFKIKAGDSFVINFTDINIQSTAQVAVGFRIANSSKSIAMMSSGDLRDLETQAKTITGTIEDDTEIGCAFIYCDNSAEISASFNMKLYINGTRYI